MDNRLKEMNDYISIIEKKSLDLIKKYHKTNQDLNSAIQKIGELTNKLEKSESSIKQAKKNIDNLIAKIKNGRFN
jgi:septal ring factor EnvC (AmiA/AmiB activator)|tara:strand:+ start:54 stop:278 length:225 start_codon:yes stop_codon:yes gene_type:complete